MLFSISVGIEGASSEDNELKPGRFLFYNCAIETTFSQFIFFYLPEVNKIIKNWTRYIGFLAF